MTNINLDYISVRANYRCIILFCIYTGGSEMKSYFLSPSSKWYFKNKV